MFKTFTLASIQAYLAMAEDKSTTCVNDGGEWQNGWCYTGADRCAIESAGEWKWAKDTKECLPESAMKKKDEADCVNDGGDWLYSMGSYYCSGSDC